MKEYHSACGSCGKVLHVMNMTYDRYGSAGWVCWRGYGCSKLTYKQWQERGKVGGVIRHNIGSVPNER